MGTLVEPLEEMVSEEDPARYDAYSWGDFFCTRRRSNFRKMDADNIQIAHLRKEYKGKADSKPAMPASRLNESDIARTEPSPGGERCRLASHPPGFDLRRGEPARLTGDLFPRGD